jgi:hypothetical protein
MSEVKVNKISPRTNCGTVQLGDSGDTFTIPSGATITNNGTAAGFGATGAASWDTTVKTASFTGVAGVGYFVNTTSGAITVTLPASPDAGAVIAVKDYANTFDTNNVTLARNGSNIGGQAIDATLSTEGLAVTLVYVDATKGWLVTDDGLQSQAPTAQFVTATGGTITCCGDFKIHTFTGPGTFCVSCAGNAQGSNSVDYMVVAGGGGGAQSRGGGGGAGGFRESSGAASGCYTASPLGACVSALPVTVQGYPITVGGGGGGGTDAGPSACGIGTSGSNSIFSSIISAGGGGGAPGCANTAPYGPVPVQRTGLNGGSGGGGGSGNDGGGCGGAGNTPPVSPAQGFQGGNACGGNVLSAGGGGATAAGAFGAPGNGNGGAGATSSINGTPTARAGGGGGGAPSGLAGDGGTGGGGPGASPTDQSPNGLSGGDGSTNTGGGGGGAAAPSGYDGGNGGSGVVIIRYKFQ